MSPFVVNQKEPTNNKRIIVVYHSHIILIYDKLTCWFRGKMANVLPKDPSKVSCNSTTDSFI